MDIIVSNEYVLELKSWRNIEESIDRKWWLFHTSKPLMNDYSSKSRVLPLPRVGGPEQNENWVFYSMMVITIHCPAASSYFKIWTLVLICHISLQFCWQLRI